MTGAAPYNIWQTRKLLGVYRDAMVEPLHWLDYFTSEFTSEEEYIDFEKLPLLSRQMAQFTLPLGRGNSVYDDSMTLSRFKPAYAKLEDEIDPLMPLIKRAGIDPSIIEPTSITPMQRLDLIRTAMAASQFAAMKRRHNWMACKAVQDGKVTCSGPGYPTTLVDFQRDSSLTVVLGSGSRFGDSGVSIVDFVQGFLDNMQNLPFGALPDKITMGSSVWAVARKDAEFMSHMDIRYRGGNITFERGLVNSGVRGDKRFKVGEFQVGGGSGATIEMWVDNNTYTDPVTKAQTKYVAATDMIFTGTPDDISGYQCFGRIIDRDAEYQPIPIFPKNWVDRSTDTPVERLTTKSAPLMVPIAPNSTGKATVTAS